MLSFIRGFLSVSIGIVIVIRTLTYASPLISNNRAFAHFWSFTIWFFWNIDVEFNDDFLSPQGTKFFNELFEIESGRKTNDEKSSRCRPCLQFEIRAVGRPRGQLALQNFALSEKLEDTIRCFFLGLLPQSFLNSDVPVQFEVNTFPANWHPKLFFYFSLPFKDLAIIEFSYF